MSTTTLKHPEHAQNLSPGEKEKAPERYPEKKLPDAAHLQLRRAPNGSLEMHVAEADRQPDQPAWIEVRVHRCFPWMSPAGCLSLRNSEGEEVAFIETLDDLPEPSAAVLRQDLKIAGFTLEITRLISLKKEIELRAWTVETANGPRQFQTELDDFPVTLPDGSLLIKDVIGDLYHIPDPHRLDKKSRKMLWGFLN